jgi:hypothetical protein
MATAGAIIGLRVPGVVVEDIATTTKTLPDFPGLWAGMLADGHTMETTTSRPLHAARLEEPAR